MGAFDWLSQAGDWLKNRWDTDWKDLRTTFKDSWTGIPQSFMGMQAGIAGMVSGPFKDDGDFWGAARLWADSSVGFAGQLGGGTLGTVFQVPILHEAGWLLDKAYRYGVARPFATQFILASNSARDAYDQGNATPGTLFESLFNFNHYRQAWNDSRYVTPGQAMVYNGMQEYQMLANGMPDAMKWATEHDPKTPAGQAKFNSANAETLLKYGSGSLDFGSVFFADPAHGLGKAFKLGKLRYVDHVADAKFVMAGKVHDTVGTSTYNTVREVAQKAKSPEEFGQLTMPDNPYRGRLQTLLWTAARMDDDAYRDTYLTTFAMDPEAYQRLADRAPQIAASFGDMFANFTIRDLDYQRGRLSSGLGADALQKTQLDAFIDSFAGQEGIWGSAFGAGVGTKLPKASPLSRWRTGYHDNVLMDAPVVVGRPLANLMPSQGWTPIIDAMDGSAYSLRQFKANIERSTTRENAVLSSEEINRFASWYGSAGSDGTRHTIAGRIDNLIIQRTLKQFGIEDSDLQTVLKEVNRGRNGLRRIMAYQRIYISEESARRAEKLAATGDIQAAQNLLAFSDAWKKKVADGEVTDGYWLAADDQGRLNITPVPGSPYTVDRTLPVLRSQFGSAITMTDYRALRSALRWWKLTHPEPTASLWRTRLGQAAKARGLYEAGIGALDAASSIWKASALFRPAQAPRNVASDTLHTIAAFGKLPVLMSTAHGFVNLSRNLFGLGGRAGLVWDYARELRTRRVMDGTDVLGADADVDIHVPGNIEPERQYTSLHTQFADGQISLAHYMREIERDATVAPDVQYHKPNLQERQEAKRKADRAKGKQESAFTPTASRSLHQANVAEEQRRQYIQRLVDQGHTLEDAVSRADTYASQGGFSAASARGHMGAGASPAAPAKQSKPSKPVSEMSSEEFRAYARGRGATDAEVDEVLRAGQVVSGAERAEATARVELLRRMEAEAPSRQPAELPEGGSYRVGGRENFSPRGFTERRFEAASKPLSAEMQAIVDESESYSVGEATRGRRVIEPLYRDYKAGDQMFVPSFLYRRFAKGEMEGPEYGRALAQYALTVAGKSWFLNSKRGMALIKDLVQRHLNRRQDEGYADNPYAPGTLVIDPFHGTQPKIAQQNIADHFDISSEAVLPTRNRKGRLGKREGTWESVTQAETYEAMKRFILEKADDLTKPDTLLALRVKPDGNIAVGFARAKPETIAAGHALKVSAKERLKNFRYDGIRDMGHTGLKIRVAGGKVIELPGVFENPVGQEYQRRVSARDNPATGFGALVRDVDMETLLEEPGSWKVMRYGEDPEYKMSWERAVNAQLASDPVAHMAMVPKANGQFRSYEELLSQVDSTAWGSKWIHAMAFRGADYGNMVKTIWQMVNDYLPEVGVSDELFAKAKALRVAASQGKATARMLEDMFRDDEGNVDATRMPQVHGASIADVTGNSRSWRYLRQQVSRVQKVINDMPTDKWARFPFMAMSYQRHASELLKVANHVYGDADLIPARVKDQIVEAAREKAYHDVRYRLYDTAQRNDIAAATRLLMPFSAAMMDSYIKYGRLIRENPMLLLQGAYYWDTFEREGMVQDENGYVEQMIDGSQRWFAIDPKTGQKTEVPGNKVGRQRYIQFQLPTELGNVLLGQEYYGVKANPVIAINKETLNVFANLPSGGPLVAFPANEFALSHPDFGENRFIQQYLLPYGPTSSRGKTFLPATVRAAWDSFNNQDQDTAAGHAAAIMQAELIGYGLGTRTAPPTFAEVRDKANGLRFLRLMSTLASPATFQINSPYQLYIDSYRQMVAADPEHAAENFINRHGDEFYAVQMSVTRNNAGVSATLKSSEAYDKYKALIQKYPDFGGLIVGREGGGAFAKSVYESQKDTPVAPGDTRTMRELLSLKDSTDDLQRKATWTQYGRMMDLITAALVDRGLRSVNDRGAEDLKATKDAFVEKNRLWDDPATGTKAISPWYTDFKDDNPAKTEQKFLALQAIASDPLLQQRDDMRGLATYLAERKKMQYEMSYWGYKSLDSQKSLGLKNKWQIRVHDMITENHAFADLWNRWLSTDDKLDIPSIPDWANQPKQAFI